MTDKDDVFQVDDEMGGPGGAFLGDGPKKLGPDPTVSGDIPKLDEKPAEEKAAKKPADGAVQKFRNLMLRKAGLDKFPELSVLTGKIPGKLMAIKEVALFVAEPEDEVLHHVWKVCSTKNVVHLSAPVRLKRVMEVGVEILKDGKMLHSMLLSVVGDSKQCVSGRHRMTFLAIVYGTNVKVPIDVGDFDLEDARLAAVKANETRKTETLEKAERAVVDSLGGDLAAGPEARFDGIKNKAGSTAYCTFQVLSDNWPKGLDFEVSYDKSKSKGELATIGAVKSYFQYAVDWSKAIRFDEHCKSLDAAISFLNAMAKAFEKTEGFDKNQHMSYRTSSAVGRIFKDHWQSNQPMKSKQVMLLAKVVVSMGPIGSQAVEETYQEIRRRVAADG